jgi:FtsZ-interacting cell division protein ZipA
MTGYHDYVLGLIPAFVLGPIAASSLVGLSVQLAVAAGGAAAALVIGHAMFVRGPVPTRSAPETHVASVDGSDETATVTADSGVTATDVVTEADAAANAAVTSEPVPTTETTPTQTATKTTPTQTATQTAAKTPGQAQAQSTTSRPTQATAQQTTAHQTTQTTAPGDAPSFGPAE